MLEYLKKKINFARIWLFSVNKVSRLMSENQPGVQNCSEKQRTQMHWSKVKWRFRQIWWPSHEMQISIVFF